MIRLSADEALNKVPPKGRVYVASGIGHPDTLVKPLLRRARAVGPLTIVTSLLGPLPGYCQPAAAATCRVLSFRGTGPARQAIRDGQVEVVPTHLSGIPRLMHGPLRPDVALVQVTPPDAAGRCSLGPSVLYQQAAIRAANTVIAEVNPMLPWTDGDSMVALCEIDVLVAGEHPLPHPEPFAPSLTELAVADTVVDLIPDGCTLQVGMGGVGEAVMQGLSRRRGLRLHTGLVSDGLLKLLDSSALADGDGVVVCGAAYGSDALYQRIQRNPRVLFRGVEYTHNPVVMAGLDQFIAINSAVEVDLSGQINAESVDGLPISGTGGQGDFLRGAALAQHGLAVIAVTATSAGGTRSRIVRRLQSPGVVSTPRTDVHMVITEFGLADVRGQGLRDRAAALRAVADPRLSSALED